MAASASTTTARPDTRDMVIVHRVFRREFRLMPAVIRNVAEGDTARVATVAAHCDELMTALHHHHSGEDDLVWPRLRERAEVDQELIASMERQHAQVAELLDQAHAALAEWRRSASAADRDRLADTLSEVSTVLDEHLGQEEREILPLVEQHLTLAEWDELGKRGMASIPRERMLVFLGHLLEETSPEERRMFLGHVPLPGRVAFRLVGQRKWQREVDDLRAGIDLPAQRRPS